MSAASIKSLLLFLVLIIAAATSAGCITSTGTPTDESDTGKASKNTIPHKLGEVPAALLPTLEVSRAEIYVYLQPKKSAHNFGPLQQGEKVKRIDTRRNWVLIWIPRLKITGWVGTGHVQEIADPSPETGGVPKEFLNTVTVKPGRVNIREAPSTRSDVIFQAKKGRKFRMVRNSKGWIEIWLPDLGRTGWIFEKIVTKDRRN